MKDIQDPSSNPLVSIIVPTLNRNKFIQRCVKSILGQTYRNLECVIVDGGSVDGSLETFEMLRKQDPRVRFISEPDDGEVYAVNKGLDIARGEIVGVQNSDDFYLPDAVETSVEFLLRNPEYIGVSGDARYVDEAGNDLGRGVITYRGEMSKRYVRRILILRHKSTFVCHGAFFGWRERLGRHGRFDPAFGVMPDLEFYSRLLYEGEKIGCLPRHQFNFTVHSEMGALKHAERVERQRKQLHEKYGMNWYHWMLWMLVGKAYSYISNPYRSPFREGLNREIAPFLNRIHRRLKKS